MSTPTDFDPTTLPPAPAPARPDSPAQAMERWSTEWIATPPPLPPPVPAQPLAAQPRPTQPNEPHEIPFATAPIPVIPLAYAEPSLPTRPTGLVVIGVMSVLVGVVSILINGYGLFYLASRYSRSVPPPPPPPAAPLPPATVTPHFGDFVRPRGMKQPERAIVMAAVAQHVALPADRAILLERFLADIGRDAFGDSAVTSMAAVTGMLRETGQEKLGRDGAGALGTHYIVTAHGRIGLDNTVATFVADRAPASPVTLEGNMLTDAAGTSRWCAAAMDEWLERLAAGPGRPIMTAQQAAVLLEHVGNLPVTPRNAGRHTYDFTFARLPDQTMFVNGNPRSGGVLSAMTPGRGMLYILPDGRSATAAQAPNGIGPAPDYLPVTPSRARYFAPALPGSLNAIRASIAVETVGLALAIVLLVAGVRTLAGWRGGAGLHLAWAAVKIAFSFVAIAVAVWWITTIRSPQYFQPAWMAKAVGGMMFALVYPGVVYAVINSAAVRGYYRSIGEPMWVFSPQRRAAWRLEFAEIAGSTPGRAVLWVIMLAGGCAASMHLFAAVHAMTDGAAGGSAVTRMGEHGVAIVFAGGVAAAAYWLGAWSQRAGGSVATTLAADDAGGRA